MIPIRERFSSAPAGTKTPTGLVYTHGEAELFHQGHVTVVNQSASGSSAPKPLRLGDASVIFGRIPFRFSMDDGGTILVIGLKPQPKISGGDRR